MNLIVAVAIVLLNLYVVPLQNLIKLDSLAPNILSVALLHKSCISFCIWDTKEHAFIFARLSTSSEKLF